MPLFRIIFEVFWTTIILLDIVTKTNQYAKAIDET